MHIGSITIYYKQDNSKETKVKAHGNMSIAQIPACTLMDM